MLLDDEALKSIPEPIIEYVPEDVSPGELIQLVNRLADEVAKWRAATARYEAEAAEARAAHRLRLSEAKVLHQGKGSATIINAMADTTKTVVDALKMLTDAEARFLLASGRYEGVLAQYQSLKQSIALKIEELRTFRG